MSHFVPVSSMVTSMPVPRSGVTMLFFSRVQQICLNIPKKIHKRHLDNESAAFPGQYALLMISVNLLLVFILLPG
jgi:hypothetical protein